MSLIDIRIKKCAIWFVPDCHMNKKNGDKTIDYYSHELEFVPDCYKAQKIGDKAVDTCPFSFDPFPD